MPHSRNNQSDADLEEQFLTERQFPVMSPLDAGDECVVCGLPVLVGQPFFIDSSGAVHMLCHIQRENKR